MARPVRAHSQDAAGGVVSRGPAKHDRLAVATTTHVDRGAASPAATMTAIPLENRSAASGRSSAVGPAAATCLALGLAVAVRWQIFRTGMLDGVTEGLVFGWP